MSNGYLVSLLKTNCQVYVGNEGGEGGESTVYKICRHEGGSAEPTVVRPLPESMVPLISFPEKASPSRSFSVDFKLFEPAPRFSATPSAEARCADSWLGSNFSNLSQSDAAQERADGQEDDDTWFDPVNMAQLSPVPTRPPSIVSQTTSLRRTFTDSPSQASLPCWPVYFDRALPRVSPVSIASLQSSVARASRLSALRDSAGFYRAAASSLLVLYREFDLLVPNGHEVRGKMPATTIREDEGRATTRLIQRESLADATRMVLRLIRSISAQRYGNPLPEESSRWIVAAALCLQARLLRTKETAATGAHRMERAAVDLDEQESTRSTVDSVAWTPGSYCAPLDSPKAISASERRHQIPSESFLKKCGPEEFSGAEVFLEDSINEAPPTLPQYPQKESFGRKKKQRRSNLNSATDEEDAPGSPYINLDILSRTSRRRAQDPSNQHQSHFSALFASVSNLLTQRRGKKGDEKDETGRRAGKMPSSCVFPALAATDILGILCRFASLAFCSWSWIEDEEITTTEFREVLVSAEEALFADPKEVEATRRTGWRAPTGCLEHISSISPGEIGASVTRFVFERDVEFTLKKLNHTLAFDSAEVMKMGLSLGCQPVSALRDDIITDGTFYAAD